MRRPAVRRRAAAARRSPAREAARRAVRRRPRGLRRRGGGVRVVAGEGGPGGAVGGGVGEPAGVPRHARGGAEGQQPGEVRGEAGLHRGVEEVVDRDLSPRRASRPSSVRRTAAVAASSRDARLSVVAHDGRHLDRQSPDVSGRVPSARRTCSPSRLPWHACAASRRSYDVPVSNSRSTCAPDGSAPAFRPNVTMRAIRPWWSSVSSCCSTRFGGRQFIPPIRRPTRARPEFDEIDAGPHKRRAALVSEYLVRTYFTARDAPREHFRTRTDRHRFAPHAKRETLRPGPDGEGGAEQGEVKPVERIAKAEPLGP